MTMKLRCVLVAIAVFAATATVTDAVLVFSGPSRGDLPNVARALFSSLEWAVRVGFLLSCGSILVAVLLSALTRRGGVAAWAAAAATSAEMVFLLSREFLATLNGPEIGSKSWIGAVRIGGVVLLAIGATIFARSFAAAATARPERRRAILGWAVPAAVLSIVAVAAIDARVFPHLYPSFHVFLQIAIFPLTAILAGALSAGPAFAGRRAVASLFLGLIFVGAIGHVFPPLGNSMKARSIAFTETLFLKRALAYLKPEMPVVRARTDLAMLDAIKNRPILDAATLDRLFPDRARWNVLFVSIDAVRFDRLEKKRDDRPLMPNLSAWARDAIFFERAATPYPSTLPSFSAIFRGRYPSATDIRYEGRRQQKIPDAERQSTFAESMRSSGRRAEAILGFREFLENHFIRNERFDAVNGDVRNSVARPIRAVDVANFAIAALDRSAAHPFFLWVHFFDPHPPHERIREKNFGDTKPDFYDAKLAETDEHFGRFMNALKDRGLAETTVIVVFSDHGTELGEHGGKFDHGFLLNETQTHVPLLIRVPGLAPRRIKSPVDLVALTPTVREILGIAANDAVQAPSLLPYLLRGDPDGESRAGFPPPLSVSELSREGNLPGARQIAVRHGNWKLIADLSSGVDSLFDLETDPAEEKDLSASHPGDLERMRGVLAAWRAATGIEK